MKKHKADNGDMCQVIYFYNGLKGFCVTIVYLQTMTDFHVEASTLVPSFSEMTTFPSCSGLLKK